MRSAGWGVQPLTLRWDPDREIDVVGRPLALALGLHRRREHTALGETIEIDVVAIKADLEVTTTKRRIDRVGEGTWQVLAVFGAAEGLISIDPDGLPSVGANWALERDARER